MPSDLPESHASSWGSQFGRDSPGNCKGQTSFCSRWKAVRQLSSIYQTTFFMNRGTCGVKAAARHQGRGKQTGIGQPLSFWGSMCLRGWAQWSLAADWDNTRSHHRSQKSWELHGGNTFFKFLYTSAKAAWGLSLPSLVFMRCSPLSQVVWLSSKALLQLPGQGLFSGVNLHRIRP